MEIKVEQKLEEASQRDLKQEQTLETKQEEVAVPTLDSKSRKIQKKREKYQKIDDNIRLQLLDAVHKNGELLKTVIITPIPLLNCYNRLPRD